MTTVTIIMMMVIIVMITIIIIIIVIIIIIIRLERASKAFRKLLLSDCHASTNRQNQLVDEHHLFSKSQRKIRKVSSMLSRIFLDFPGGQNTLRLLRDEAGAVSRPYCIASCPSAHIRHVPNWHWPTLRHVISHRQKQQVACKVGDGVRQGISSKEKNIFPPLIGIVGHQLVCFYSHNMAAFPCDFTMAWKSFLKNLKIKRRFLVHCSSFRLK